MGALFRSTIDVPATFSLILANFAFALNTFTIASVYAFIPVDLSRGVSGLGLTTSLFYVGTGLTLVPAGIAAAKIGAKRTIVCGTLVYSIAAALSGFSDTFYQIALLRFTIGVGTAIILGPSIALVTKHFRQGSEGLAVGLINAGFGIGGVAGLFAWAILGQLIGWRYSLLMGGVVGLVSGLMLFLTVPADVRRPEFRLRGSDLRKLMVSRPLFLLGLVLLSLTIGTGLFGYFVVFYLHDNLGIDASTAGFVGSLWLLFVLFIAPLAGRTYDRSRDSSKLLLIGVAVLSVGVALPAFGNVYVTVLGAALVGLAAGSTYTVLISLTRDANKSDGHEEYESMAVNWVNAISYGGFWAPLLFSYTATTFGYAAGWLVGGLATFVWVIPLFIARFFK